MVGRALTEIAPSGLFPGVSMFDSASIARVPRHRIGSKMNVDLAVRPDGRKCRICNSADDDKDPLNPTTHLAWAYKPKDCGPPSGSEQCQTHSSLLASPFIFCRKGKTRASAVPIANACGGRDIREECCLAI